MLADFQKKIFIVGLTS